MPTLPALDKNVNHSPHVVIMGAGASLAAFPDGEATGRKLPLMATLIDILGLESMIKSSGFSIGNNDFEGFYDDLVSSNCCPELVKEIGKRVFEYFSQMQLPDTPTIYDYLVLSLREKDIIATFNWDPFLIQAYRRNSFLKRLPRLAFLHGNVGIGICHVHKRCGYADQKCDICQQPLTASKLLYPVKHKDYNSDLFIKNEWDNLRRHVNHAYFLTIFGYSAPATDVEAKELMLEVWKKNRSLELAEVEIIDIKPREKIEDTWEGFTYSHHYGVTDDIFNSYLFIHPRRTCDAFAEATLMCHPWQDNRFPIFGTLKELHQWIAQLIAEEGLYEKTKEKFSGLPCSNLN